ncbi:hypothetical protein FWG76_00595 [Candidatus Saccharibacteria bacterium]|nr:hypothetical protein [Candidatus Saccharibacteria bacterium]
MADSVFGGAPAKQPVAGGDGGVFGGASKKAKPVAAGGGVFGAAEKAPKAAKSASGGVFGGATAPSAEVPASEPVAEEAKLAAEAPVPAAQDPFTDPADQTATFGAGEKPVARTFSWNKVLKFGLPALAVVLLGGGALAFFMLQNSDDKIIGDAISNLLKDNDVRVDGEVVVTNIGGDSDKINVKFGVRARSDASGLNGDMSAELKVRPTIASVEALDGSKEFSGTIYGAYVDESIYLKADYVRIVDQVVAAFAPSEETIEWPEEFTRFNDRWLMVSNQTLTNFLGSDSENMQKCMQNQLESLHGNSKAGRELFKMLTTVIKFDRESKSGQTITYTVAPSGRVSDYHDFLVMAQGSEIVRGFVGCADNYRAGLSDDFLETLDEAIKGLQDMTEEEREQAEETLAGMLKDLPKITVEINTRTRRFTAVTVKGSVGGAKVDVKLEIDSKHDKGLSIAAPSDYLELKESDLNSLGELEINNILNAGALTAQMSAVDLVRDMLEEGEDFNAAIAAVDDFTVRVLNRDGETFPDSYREMTYSGPFYLQEYAMGSYNAIRYSRYGDSTGDIWIIFGAACKAGVSSTVERSSGSSAVLTYLGDGQYYCAD